jgi:hypothetical protein
LSPPSVHAEQIDTSGLVLQFPQVVTPTRCRALAALFDKRCGALEARAPGQDASVFLLDGQWSPAAREQLVDAMEACILQMASLTTPEGSRGNESVMLYPETLALAKLSEGEAIPRHHDNGDFDAQGRWVPNSHRARAVSAVLYLNDDFDGGHLIFDRQRLVVRPAPGLLVVFPSGQHCPHRVEPVCFGRRYTMPMWFTTHRWHALLPRRFTFKWPATAPAAAWP